MRLTDFRGPHRPNHLHLHLSFPASSVYPQFVHIHLCAATAAGFGLCLRFISKWNAVKSINFFDKVLSVLLKFIVYFRFRFLCALVYITTWNVVKSNQFFPLKTAGHTLVTNWRIQLRNIVFKTLYWMKQFNRRNFLFSLSGARCVSCLCIETFFYFFCLTVFDDYCVYILTLLLLFYT